MNIMQLVSQHTGGLIEQQHNNALPPLCVH